MGNPLSYYNGDRYTFSWTEGRKLASSTYDGRTTTYEYDHEGLRTKKEKSDGSYILYDIVDGRAVGETHYNANHAVQYNILRSAALKGGVGFATSNITTDMSTKMFGVFELFPNAPAWKFW